MLEIIVLPTDSCVLKERPLTSGGNRQARFDTYKLAPIELLRRTSSLDRPGTHTLQVRDREDLFPIRLHADYGPTVDGRRIQCHVEPAEMRIAVVGVFTFGVGVMHDHARSDADRLQGSPIAASRGRHRNCRRPRSGACRCAR